MNDLLDSFFNLNSAGAIAAPATTFIYGLNCPVTGKCRYVGKADDPQERFGRHLLLARKSNTHKNCWIRGLAAQGLEPVLEVIDEVPKAEWQFWEREYIRVFHMIGFSLTNLTDGGEGALGVKRSKESPEAKLRMSETLKAAWKAGKYSRRKKRSPEFCAKMSEAIKAAWKAGKFSALCTGRNRG